jgi:hypothetical protein
LTALVPVGLAAGEGRDMGNRVSALFVKIPLATEDPVEALEIVSAETRALKKDHQEQAAADALRLLDPVPQTVLSAGARLIRRQPFFNLIVTNVPGPPFPLYTMGARMLEAFPVVPLVGNEGLAVAALSYNGALNLGILSDPTVCPDVPVFCRGATETFRDLVARSLGTPGRARHASSGAASS